jgi:hypothetical protein
MEGTLHWPLAGCVGGRSATLPAGLALENVAAFTCFGVWVVCAFAVPLQAHRLYAAFVERFPEVAAREFKPPGIRDPRKLDFFLEKRNEHVYRSDAVVWGHRVLLGRVAIGAAVVACVASVAFFGGLIVVGLWRGR